MREHEEHVVSLNVDRLLKWVLPQVHGRRECRQVLFCIRCVIVDNPGNDMFLPDTWRLVQLREEAQEGVPKQVVQIFVNCGNFTNVDGHGLTDARQSCFNIILVLLVILLFVADSQLMIDHEVVDVRSFTALFDCLVHLINIVCLWLRRDITHGLFSRVFFWRCNYARDKVQANDVLLIR